MCQGQVNTGLSSTESFTLTALLSESRGARLLHQWRHQGTEGQDRVCGPFTEMPHLQTKGVGLFSHGGHCHSTQCSSLVLEISRFPYLSGQCLRGAGATDAMGCTTELLNQEANCAFLFLRRQ